MKKVEKPWGYEILFAHTESYIGKVLKIYKGEMLSLQYHKVKDETIYLFEGEMLLDVEENGDIIERRLLPGDSYRIRPNVKHRMKAVEECTVFEVSTPHLEDVVRLEDKYGRVKS
ncbi:MAG: cupin domain-containing protein [Candidatus Aminicenantia bacterium]